MNKVELAISTPQFKALEVGNPDSAWMLDNGKTIYLLTQEELYKLQRTSPSTILISIMGAEKVAIDCDDGIRYGYVAFGLYGVES